jgi:hypothetical protein
MVLPAAGAAHAGIPFQRHAAFRAIPRLVRLDAGTHRAIVFGGGRRRHRRSGVVTLMRMVVVRVAVSITMRLPATAGMFLWNVFVFAAAVVGVFSFTPITTAIRFGRRVL